MIDKHRCQLTSQQRVAGLCHGESTDKNVCVSVSVSVCVFYMSSNNVLVVWKHKIHGTITLSPGFCSQAEDGVQTSRCTQFPGFT